MPDVKKGYSLTHAHKFYEKKHGVKIEKSLYKNICYEFNKELVNVILTGRIVKLPHRVGDLWIKKIKTDWTNPPIDLNASKKAGKKIYHLNSHSDGWWARWYWTRNNSPIPNINYYAFDATRDNSRAVAAIMKQENGYKRFFS